MLRTFIANCSFASINKNLSIKYRIPFTLMLLYDKTEFFSTKEAMLAFSSILANIDSFQVHKLFLRFHKNLELINNLDIQKYLYNTI